MVVLGHLIFKRKSLIYWAWTLRVAVFGATSIVTDSKTVTVC